MIRRHWNKKMAKRIEAIVEPKLLIWARESIGLSIKEAARKIRVKPEQLESWELGEARPSISQLRRAAGNAYKRPLAVFFLPEPPKTLAAMRDFRRLSEEEPVASSPALLLEIRRAHTRRKTALELAEHLQETIPQFKQSVSITDDPDKVATKVRKMLGISLEEQTAWTSQYTALNAWKTAIEDLNTLVFHMSHLGNTVQVSEVRGFSISEPTLPVIVVNSRDSVNARIFTILHEFTHLLLNNGGMCDLREYRSLASEEQKAEVFCNRVAGSTLVPAEAVRSEEVVLNREYSTEWDDTELSELASRFSVSREVILRRLLILEMTTDEFYNRKRGEFRKAYEEQRKKKKDTGGFAPHHRLIIRNNGPAYTKLVLNAYYRDAITVRDVSDYLGIKIKHIGKIEREVMGIP